MLYYLNVYHVFSKCELYAVILHYKIMFPRFIFIIIWNNLCKEKMAINFVFCYVILQFLYLQGYNFFWKTWKHEKVREF